MNVKVTITHVCAYAGEGVAGIRLAARCPVCFDWHDYFIGEEEESDLDAWRLILRPGPCGGTHELLVLYANQPWDTRKGPPNASPTGTNRVYQDTLDKKKPPMLDVIGGFPAASGEA